jgi:hypothetical protein
MNLRDVLIADELVVETPFAMTINDPTKEVQISQSNNKISIKESGFILTPGCIVHVKLSDNLNNTFILNENLLRNNISVLGHYNNYVMLSNNNRMHSVKLNKDMVVGKILI